MAVNFKTRFRKASAWFALLFVLFFVYRLVYGYVVKDKNNASDYSDNFFSSIDNLRKNYASEKLSMKGGDVQAASAIASNQKYEKTASVKLKTGNFEQDEKQLKTTSGAFNAVIQYEQNLGQKGSRQIHLLIGVAPEAFDSLYNALKTVAALKATEITKVDKTNEYRQLNAKKASIEKTLQSLNELKSKGGEISDFVSLNDKILEIEEKAQELGVELGNFDSENEFCTIKLSMYEGAVESQISFMHRVKVALEWTLKYYALFVFGILLTSLTIFIVLLIADKLKVMNALFKKLNG